MTAQQAIQSNPWMTYAFAIGYVTGLSAKTRNEKFAGLSVNEWRAASDDYAHGYRHAFAQTD